ncbi:MAG TPA: putative Ig domain-containing protein [Candidatus Sulfotelmatobacter sp.]|nr:putative Ig domain-containing protein [Candidatus Sulfotelmatobacter sp.]
MEKWRKARWIPGLVILVACGTACQIEGARAGEQQAAAQDAPAASQEDRGPVIENDSELPDTHPHAPYEFRFRAHGRVSTLHWRVEKGTLPPGMKLEDDGLLHGNAERMGEFQFTVSVTDGGRERAVQKGFVLRVTSALSLQWKAGGHVNGNRIEGSAEVLNTTRDDIDLTFYVLAVASNGRATAIGYQHFVLRPGTKPVELPFGETLPFGGYKVHVDAVGEVAARNLIYREYLETPGLLQVTVGP